MNIAKMNERQTLTFQLRLRLLVLVAVSFVVAIFVLWKGETIRSRRDVERLLQINYRDVKSTKVVIKF